MKYLKTYNESLRDKMKPKSNEEILKDLERLSPNDMFIQSLKYNYFKGAEKALKNGATNINKLDNFDIGNTFLILASSYNDIDKVDFLIKNGADINIKNIFGNTALIYATKKRYKDIVELLLKNGADLNIKDNEGNNALMWALKYGYNDIVELLKKYGAK